jgi:fucose permease
MSFLLLAVIYLIFVSLGLPDSMLGSSFPAIAANLHVAKEMAGYIAVEVSGMTIISSLLSTPLVKKLTAKGIVSISVLLTAIGLVSFSLVTENYIWALFLAAIPLGLGAGAIDATLNNYVALHYKAIHMNWLHCSWGVGASIGPLVIGSFIDSSNNSAGWNKGVLTIAIVQLAIFVIALASFPLWNKAEEQDKKLEKEESTKEPVDFKTSSLFKQPIFYLSMFGFFCYCALETTTGLWSGSFFCYAKGMTTAMAATLTSLFYIGITVGRFICGPLSLKLNEKVMIRIGEALLAIGAIITALPLNVYGAGVGIVLIGIGCAPIYPAIIRSTPYRFSRSSSQKAMSVEMACAYVGNLAIPPLFGLTCKSLGDDYSILPYLILILLVIMISCHEVINVKLSRRDRSLSPDERKKYETL